MSTVGAGARFAKAQLFAKEVMVASVISNFRSVCRCGLYYLSNLDYLDDFIMIIHLSIFSETYLILF